MNKLKIDQLNVTGQRVLMRVDFNVPLDEHQRITDDTRIRAALPSINYVLENGGRLILMSHLGRPKGVDPKFSLKPVADRLSELLGKPVKLAPGCVGAEVTQMVANMQNGDCLVLENTRFYPEEKKNDPNFAAELAKLGDLYVNDAFGSAHRAHASTEGVCKHFNQCAAGFLMQKEIDYLGNAINNPQRPFVAILGGAKVSGKIDVIENLLGKVDTLLIGGGMAYTFFKAQGWEIGDSLLEEDRIDVAKTTLQNAKHAGIDFQLPVDCVIADKFDNNATRKTVSVQEIPAGWQGLDIGPETIRRFKTVISKAKTIVWNGPMGVFEMPNFATGTIAIAEALAAATANGATTIIGGGDSAAAVTQAGLADKMSHISTGGGASLEMMEGKILPGLAALTDVGESV